MDMDDQTGYKWESAYTEGLNIRNVLEENESGSIEDAVRRIVNEAKRQRRLVERPSHIRLGIMRYLYIVVDASASMLNKALYPTRVQMTVARINAFLTKFFEQNPLSQIGVIACRDKRAERIVGFNSSPQMIHDALSTITITYCNGEFSLESGLVMALQSFQGLPGHSSKEVLVISSSLVTVDAGNVFTTFETLKARGIRCSMIGLTADVSVYKRMCTTTSGRYGVVLDESHFELLIADHIQPPAVGREQEASIVKMGFPRRAEVRQPSFCMCHQLAGSGNEFVRGVSGGVRAYHCPQCAARYCQTPVECRICSLLLLTAPQLARAHQHLEPLPAFAEVTMDAADGGERRTCYSCDVALTPLQKLYSCKSCKAVFCIDCDLSLHESLQICPSCG